MLETIQPEGQPQAHQENAMAVLLYIRSASKKKSFQWQATA
jgi:hypothetical protein